MLQSLWMLVAAFFFAAMTACVKVSAGDAGTFEIVFYRSIICLAVVWALMCMQGTTIRTQHIGGHIKRSVLGTVAFTMWFATMGHLPLGTATTLNYTAPLFIAGFFVVTALLKKEKAPWMLALAIIVGFLGVCLILQPSLNEQQLPWALLGLTAGAMGPFIFFQIKQLGQLREPSLRIVFYFSLVGTVWGLAGTYLLEGGLKLHESSTTWLALLGVGLTAAIAQMCLTRSFAYGNMMLTACFQFATIPFAELFSRFVFNEDLPMTALLGMALIFASGSAATVITKKFEKQRAATLQKKANQSSEIPTHEKA